MEDHLMIVYRPEDPDKELLELSDEDPMICMLRGQKSTIMTIITAIIELDPKFQMFSPED